MKPINELDEAGFKHEMRFMYKEIGLEGSLQCLYEIIKSAELLCEVIKEENEKATKKS